MIPILFGNILSDHITIVQKESLMPERFVIYGKAG